MEPWKRKEVIGNATLYLGDCLKVLDGLRDGCQNGDISVEQGGGAAIALPTRIAVTVTDPPYGIQGAVNALASGRSKGDYETALFDDSPAYVTEKIIPFLNELRLQVPRMVMTPGQVNIHKYPEPAHMGVFYYPASTSISRWGMRLWQPIFYYGKDPHQGKLKMDSKTCYDSDRDTDHPCPKPLKSWTWLVERASLKDETVLDPFMGSGTTGVACMNLGRKFIGIEIEPKYFDIACERIENAQRQDRLFA